MVDSNGIVERFAEHLHLVDERNTADLKAGILSVYGYDDDSAFFQVSEAALAARVADLQESGKYLWPEVSPELAAFRLLSIHLIEAMAFVEPPPTKSLYTIAAEGIR